MLVTYPIECIELGNLCEFYYQKYHTRAGMSKLTFFAENAVSSKLNWGGVGELEHDQYSRSQFVIVY